MATITISDWRRFFPLPVPRPEQVQAIDFVLNQFVNENKKFVLLELGTGCGKSAVGVTVARYLDVLTELSDERSAYILTTQKILQEQYVRDFGAASPCDLLRSIKSSSNYQCMHYSDQSCGESKRVLARLPKQVAGTDFEKCCKFNCPYSRDKQEFIDSPLGITNFPYFLAETMYAKKLEPRGLLVIDECHNVEAELGKFVEVTFSEKFAKEILKCKIPALNLDKAVFEWIKKTYRPSLLKYVEKLEKMLESAFNSGVAGFKDLGKQYEMLDKHLCKVNKFLTSYASDPDSWIMNVIKTEKRGARRFEFKSIDVSSYSHEMLFRFGERVLMMSATILDKDIFCGSVGLDVTETSMLRIPSPFPTQNRPIHYMPAGSMSKDNIDKTLPILTEVVKVLLEQHATEKGIIHCVNYRIAQHIKDSLLSDRLLIHNSENRDLVLKQHTEGSLPTVLVSPSMMEGVDLADNASRFQIVCKVPFPYLGDLVVKKKMAKNKNWYGFCTVKSIIQAFGRSVRNDTDHAVSYILDSDWERFYSRNRNMFPADFSSLLH